MVFVTTPRALWRTGAPAPPSVGGQSRRLTWLGASAEGSALRVVAVALFVLPAPPFAAEPQSHDELQHLLNQLKSDDWIQVKRAAERLPGKQDSPAAVADALVAVLRRDPPAAVGEMRNATTPGEVARLQIRVVEEGRLQVEACTAAAHALVRMGSSALPSLTTALADRSLPEGSRGFAVWAAGELGPSSIPLLMQVLTDSDAGARVLAASALGRMGEAAREAIPVLEKAKADPNRLVREHATEALKRVRR